MKIFAHLTFDQKERAIQSAITTLLEKVISGEIQWDNDDPNGLQKRIDKAVAKADEEGSSGLYKAYIWQACAHDLEKIAVEMAHNAFYLEFNETAVPNIL